MSNYISNLEKILEYQFKNLKLLNEAITHSSVKNIDFNYERLEFLGDKILGFIVSKYIFKKFSSASEGEMSSIFQKYTNEKFLSLVAFELNLDKYVRVQKGDSLEKNISIMADLIESLIAAIYIDSSLAIVTNFVEKKIIASPIIVDLKSKHPKTILQEFSLKKHKIIPTYAIHEKKGPDHDPTFLVKVAISPKIFAIGEGSNLQKAQEDAANELMKKIYNNRESKH